MYQEQIKLVKLDMEDIQDTRIMKLKEKYEEELQNLKMQLQEVRGRLKLREKLIKRLFKVLLR
jgi:hypothetical protein